MLRCVIWNFQYCKQTRYKNGSSQLWDCYWRWTYNPVNKNMIGSVRMYVTDGKRRLVDLHGADTSFSLILKRLDKIM